MTIKLINGSTETVLVATQARNSGQTPNPVGPQNLRMQLTPGVALREYVGADRVEPDPVRCNSGTVSFGVTRTFDTVEHALAYLSGSSFINEPSTGELKFDSTSVFGSNHKSAVTQRTAALVGCTVAVNYSITG